MDLPAMLCFVVSLASDREERESVKHPIFTGLGGPGS
jgi:hypothetical protein